MVAPRRSLLLIALGFTATVVGRSTAGEVATRSWIARWKEVGAVVFLELAAASEGCSTTVIASCCDSRRSALHVAQPCSTFATSLDSTDFVAFSP